MVPTSAVSYRQILKATSRGRAVSKKLDTWLPSVIMIPWHSSGMFRSNGILRYRKQLGTRNLGYVQAQQISFHSKASVSYDLVAKHWLIDISVRAEGPSPLWHGIWRILGLPKYRHLASAGLPFPRSGVPRRKRRWYLAQSDTEWSDVVIFAGRALRLLHSLSTDPTIFEAD